MTTAARLARRLCRPVVRRTANPISGYLRGHRFEAPELPLDYPSEAGVSASSCGPSAVGSGRVRGGTGEDWMIDVVVVP